MTHFRNCSFKAFVAACFSASLLVTSAHAGTSVNLSYNGAPDADKNAVHVFATNLKELVEKKTNGEMTLKLFPNSMLGEEARRVRRVGSCEECAKIGVTH